MPDWPKYESHKIVQALPIGRIDKLSAPDVTILPLLFVRPPDSEGHEETPFFPTEPQMANRCKVGDYAMIYRDGYQSVCPKQEFEDGYTALVA